MQLSEAVIKQLRESGVLSQNEIAEQEGDLVVARDVLTGSRRILDKSSLTEVSTRRLLKD